MAYMSASRRSELEAQRTKYEAMLAVVEETYTNALSKRQEEYRFNSGVGDQREKFRKLKDLRKEIEWLEVQIDKINQRLDGAGVVNMNVRR